MIWKRASGTSFETPSPSAASCWRTPSRSCCKGSSAFTSAVSSKRPSPSITFRPTVLQYREQVITHLDHIKAAAGFKPKDAVQQLIREAAFTHLNRLCAYKMMEARGLIRAAVSKGIKSQGFIFYLADHPDDENRWKGGDQETRLSALPHLAGRTVRRTKFQPSSPRTIRPIACSRRSAFSTTFSTSSTASRSKTSGRRTRPSDGFTNISPQRNSATRRARKARHRSNSYELAFRNQFYTPRYVVQFLTDNTLGRIWYEMRRGDTALKEKCQYLVYRPNEVFLAEGENEPESDDGSTSYIRYRAKKDPRHLRILDPASGSGHFLLYGFDLLETIYDEAYDDPELGPQLQRDFPDRDEFRKAVPGLILRHNLHGIDIDLRATQIAATRRLATCAAGVSAAWTQAQRPAQNHQIKHRLRRADAR